MSTDSNAAYGDQSYLRVSSVFNLSTSRLRQEALGTFLSSEAAQSQLQDQGSQIQQLHMWGAVMQQTLDRDHHMVRVLVGT